MNEPMHCVHTGHSYIDIAKYHRPMNIIDRQHVDCLYMGNALLQVCGFYKYIAIAN